MKVTARVEGIGKAVANVESKVHKTARVLVLEVWNNLVERTPVASGRARANWQIVSSGYGTELPPGEYGYPSRPTVSKFQHLYIVNPLDYIQYLNQGWSQQAPAMFIQTALADAVDTIKATKRL